jgi:hypothetical protein
MIFTVKDPYATVRPIPLSTAHLKVTSDVIYEISHVPREKKRCTFLFCACTSVRGKRFGEDC